jgi:hypothetical protein
VDANAESTPRAIGVPLATAFASWLAGNMFAYMTNAQPATNARTAWLLWGLGLVACSVVLTRGVRGRPLALAATIVVGALVGGSIALSIATYAAAVRAEDGMDREGAEPRAPIPSTP